MQKNFFDYFPASTKIRSWEIYATSFGRVRVPPHTLYPPARHPEGHHFAWDQGRTLHDYQVVYIQDGNGILETASSKTRKIGPGTAFLLFPGIWHRYRPDPATGWTESWLEWSGPPADKLRKAGIIDPGNPIYRMHAVEEIEGILEEAHRLARTKPPVFSVRLGLIAVQILTLLRSGSRRRQKAPRRMENLISEAQAVLAQNAEVGSSAEQIARKLGVGYSYFRREFKRQTGFSPKQYRMEIRHRRAKEMLRNGGLTIKEISERLRYHSPYHFSHDFSKRIGLPPTVWRANNHPMRSR